MNPVPPTIAFHHLLILGMTAMFRIPFLLAALISLGDPAAAQGSASTAPAPKSQPQPASVTVREPMVFYLAKGEPDACGPGCSEWIAAEGTIDFGAPQRLRSFLARLGKRKLPIFFHSPGGLAAQAMEIGRLLRARQQMMAGVSKTNPAGCIGASDESCLVLKRSGQTLEAELGNVAACNSACVKALVGAKIRQVPPGARLGVHSGKPVQLYPDGRVKAALPGGVSPETNAQIRRYYKEMQIAAGLFDLTSKVPHEQAHYLSRDEIATFGIDTREFLESRWTGSPPVQPPSAVKFIVEAKGPGRKEFRTSIIRLACAGARRVRIGYYRGLASDEMEGARSIKFAIDNRDFSFARKGSITKIDSIDTGGSFDVRFTYEPFEFFEAAAARDSIDVIEFDPADSARPSRITKLSTNGLSKALEGLQKKCGAQPKSFDAAPAVRLPEPASGLWGRQ